MMNFVTVSKSPEESIEIIPILTNNFAEFKENLDERTKNYFQTIDFNGKNGSLAVLFSEKGLVEKVYFAVNAGDFLSFGFLPKKLPADTYHFNLENLASLGFNFVDIILAWNLGRYSFNQYKNSAEIQNVELNTLDFSVPEEIKSLVNNVFFVRDLINRAPSELNPAAFAKEIFSCCIKHSADLDQIIGDDLLKKGFNGIYAVGRGSQIEPRLLEITWGDKENKRLVLVGKGVCFDSGGLDLKSSSGMVQMKKDMAGAAIALGILNYIVENNLPIYVKVLLPLVENLPSGSSYKPGDVLKMKNGKTVEIGNTDAEGRLILADSLFYAEKFSPELVIDIATLTGAARSLLGYQVAAMFANDDKVAEDVLRCSQKVKDYLCRIPLFQPYHYMIESNIADISNNSREPWGGTITAALFLQEFVPENAKWLHFDVSGGMSADTAICPKGGEASVMRAICAYLKEKFVVEEINA